MFLGLFAGGSRYWAKFNLEDPELVSRGNNETKIALLVVVVDHMLDVVKR